jgi:hypothetical protein
MENFQRRESGVFCTTLTTRFTTNSPRCTIQKHGGNRKTPCKNSHSATQNFFYKDRRIEAWESAVKRLWTASRAMI